MTESNGETWLLWHWRYHSLSLSEHDSLEDAIDSAHWMQEAGEGVLETIEGPDGVVPADLVAARLSQLEEREREEWKAQPRSTHRLEVRGPDGKTWTTLSGHSSEDKARAALERYASLLGNDRVRVVAIR